mgnify:CR=1 FL=1
MKTKSLVAGVLALDNLKTPNRSGEKIVGGAGIYSSISSSLFTETALVAAIGNDFPKDVIEKIKKHGIDMKSVSQLDYPTFHWSGEYKGDMSQAITHKTDFRINNYYNWDIEKEHQNPPILLLCNNDPNIQLKILEQVNAKIIAMDTMNLWIDIAKEKLDLVVSQVDILFINDAEAQQYSGYQELDKVAETLLEKGPKFVIIKKGAQGASLYSKKLTKHLPAFKVNNFVDPTGAGDSFAGAAIGYLANRNTINEENLITAMNYGAAVASVTVEGFGTESIMNIAKSEIDARFQELGGGPGRI